MSHNKNEDVVIREFPAIFRVLERRGAARRLAELAVRAFGT